MNALDPDRPVGEEARKAHPERVRNGFIAAYLTGTAILDIGYRGYRDDVVPIVPGAVGVELDYPGYDGTTLPFSAGSQDAVFASHCLEHIEDFQNAIRDWFRVLKVGGHLAIMVPHKFLYEKRTDLPSRFNADHKRFYTPASLMTEIEISLQPNTYRLRRLIDNDAGFEYTLPPTQHSGGCYELELVIEKIATPAWHLANPRAEAGVSPPVIVPPDASQAVLPRRGDTRFNETIVAIAARGENVIRYDFGCGIVTNPRLLVLKLDHLGDFVIGLPSLRRLRDAFPASHITLVVGSWNRVSALASGIADVVLAYDYFPQDALGWDGQPYERVEKFKALTAGRYDVAIDLRVDEDTRHLLAMVDAGLRAGIGSQTHYPFLGAALPPEHRVRPNTAGLDTQTIELSHFESCMPFKYPFFQETDFRTEGHVIYGPHIRLPIGPISVDFSVQLIGWRLGLTRLRRTGWRPGLKKTRVTLDITRNGNEILVFRALGPDDLRTLPGDGVTLSFINDDAAATYEFRIHTAGAPIRTSLRFSGVRLRQTVPTARYRRSELHIGEQLSMLVQLVAERAKPLYDPVSLPRTPGSAKRIVIAPFSNSDLRDWPIEHYAALIRLLTDRLDCTVSLIGSERQAVSLDRLAAAAACGERVRNMGGQTSWAGIPDLLRQADLVICNNSGIAHLAAAEGVRTLAIYSASHQPQEWGPRGARSHALMLVVPCSPCGHDRLEDCPFEHRCMQDLTPEAVFGQADALLADRPASTPGLPARSDTAH